MSKVFSSITGYIGGIYSSRTILLSLVRKDLVGKYRNSFVGMGWHFLMPIFLLAIYYITFTSGVKASPVDNFVIYLASGLFVFTFMVINVTNGTSCITSNSGIIKKIYFPRELVVIAQVISTSVVMLIGYLIVFIVIVFIGFDLNPISLLLVPAIIFLAILFVLGFVLLLSSVNVYYRDIHHLINSVSIIFYFITPMYYTVDSISGSLSAIVWINPFTYYVELMHTCVYYGEIPDISLILSTVAISLVSFTLGMIVFNRLKNGFAERL